MDNKKIVSTVESSKKRRSWLEIAAVILAFLGALTSVFGAITILAYAESVATTPVWPLPGFVLLDWIALGMIGFLLAVINMLQYSDKWLFGIWLIVGALIPLIILGAFSIGPYVLIACLLFLVSACLITIQKKLRWILNLGMLVVGVLGNAGVLYIIISLGNRSY